MQDNWLGPLGKPEILPHHRKTAEPIIAYLCLGNYVADPYPRPKFTTIRSGVLTSHRSEVVDPTCRCLLVFFRLWVLPTR